MTIREQLRLRNAGVGVFLGSIAIWVFPVAAFWSVKAALCAGASLLAALVSLIALGSLAQRRLIAMFGQ